MRKLIVIIGLACLVVSCVASQPNKVGDLFVFEKFDIQFPEMGGSWHAKSLDPQQRFGNFMRFDNQSKKAQVWVRERGIPKAEVDEAANVWVNGMAKKYHWNDLKTQDEGWTELNGEKTFWKQYRFRSNNTMLSEKIYRVYYKTHAYQFRLHCREKDFPELVQEFDGWVKMIKFL